MLSRRRRRSVPYPLDYGTIHVVSIPHPGISCTKSQIPACQSGGGYPTSRNPGFPQGGGSNPLTLRSGVTRLTCWNMMGRRWDSNPHVSLDQAPTHSVAARKQLLHQPVKSVCHFSTTPIVESSHRPKQLASADGSGDDPFCADGSLCDGSPGTGTVGGRGGGTPDT